MNSAGNKCMPHGNNMRMQLPIMTQNWESSPLYFHTTGASVSIFI